MAKTRHDHPTEGEGCLAKMNSVSIENIDAFEHVGDFASEILWFSKRT